MSRRETPVKPNTLLIHSLSPIFELIEGYYNISFSGIENIPIGERFVWTHNHSGWPSMDALVIGKKIMEVNYKKTGEIDGGLAFWHDLVAKSPILKPLIQSLGGISIGEIENYQHYKKHKIFATPAEGEEGNFKSSFKERYKIQKFRSGIGRIAIAAKADYVLPVTIIGPEESFPNFGNIRVPIKSLLSQLSDEQIAGWIKKRIKKVTHRDILIPLIAPIQGLPFEWQIKFHKPINIKQLIKQSGKTLEKDKVICRQIAKKTEKVIATSVNEQILNHRPFRPSIPKIRKGFFSAITRNFGLTADWVESKILVSQKAKKWSFGWAQNLESKMADVIPITKNKKSA